jgi:hypothetical protein
LVKLVQMQYTFDDVSQEDIFKCTMFYSFISMKTREEMCDELMKVLKASDEPALTQFGNLTTTYKQLNEILRNISQSATKPIVIVP